MGINTSQPQRYDPFNLLVHALIPNKTLLASINANTSHPDAEPIQNEETTTATILEPTTGTTSDPPLSTDSISLDGDGCIGSFSWSLLTFLLMCSLAINVLCLVLEQKTKKKRDDLSNSNFKCLYSTYLWVQKVFMSSFVINCLYCITAFIIITMKLLGGNEEKHSPDCSGSLLHMVEDITFEVFCGFTLVVVGIETLSFFKLARYPDCYPNALRFNKTRMFITVLSASVIFCSLAVLEVIESLWSSTDCEDKKFYSRDEIVIVKDSTLMLFAFCALVLAAMTQLKIPKAYKTSTQKRHSVIQWENNSLEEERENLSSSERGVLSMQTDFPLLPLYEEENVVFSNGTEPELLNNNDNKNNTTKNSIFNGEDTSTLEGQSEPSYMKDDCPTLLMTTSEVDGIVCGNDEETQRQSLWPKKHLNESIDSKPSCASKKPSGHLDRFSYQTTEAINTLNNLLTLQRPPKGLDLDVDAVPVLVPIACFVFGPSWLGAWKLWNLNSVNLTHCLVIILHCFLHLSSIVFSEAEEELGGFSEKCSNYSQWMLYVLQSAFVFILLCLKPCFYVHLFMATKPKSKPNSQTAP